MFDGKWTYRSYLNDPAEVGDDAAKALALIFGEGIIHLTAKDRALTGRLDMGPGYALDLKGKTTGTDPASATFAISGTGIDGTATAGWRYDYHGGLAWTWPNGIKQVPALVGTVIRVNPHGPNAPAGVTASFVAVGRRVVPA